MFQRHHFTQGQGHIKGTVFRWEILDSFSSPQSPVFTLHYWENMCTHILSVQGFLQLQGALFLGPKYPRPFCSPRRYTWAHHALQPSYQKAVELTNRTWETRGIADDSSRGKESIKFNFNIVTDLPYRAPLTSETQTERKMPLDF